MPGCSIWAMSFNSSSAISIKARFLSRILSATLIREFFILFISCMSLRKKTSNKAYPIYSFSTQSLPFMFFRNLFLFQQLTTSHISQCEHAIKVPFLSLIIKCSLKPKNHPIKHFPHSTNPSKVLWINMRCLRHTRSGVESTKPMPIQASTKPPWWKQL